MAKKHLYYDRAEQMYVVEQLTLREIAQRLLVSERTLGDWSRDGNWDVKRKQHVEQRRLFHEDLYTLGRKLMKSVMADLEDGKEISDRRLRIILELIPKLSTAKEYEDVVNAHTGDDDAQTPDKIVDLVNQILGINK